MTTAADHVFSHATETFSIATNGDVVTTTYSTLVNTCLTATHTVAVGTHTAVADTVATYESASNTSSVLPFTTVAHANLETGAALTAARRPFSPGTCDAALAKGALHHGRHLVGKRVKVLRIGAKVVHRTKNGLVETHGPLERIQEHAQRPPNERKSSRVEHSGQILLEIERHVLEKFHRSDEKVVVKRFKSIKREIPQRNQRVLEDRSNGERGQPQQVPRRGRRRRR